MRMPTVRSLAAAAALAAAPPASADVIRYFADLSGAAESPPVASPGTGWARINVDDVAMTMRVEAMFSDLLAGVTVAHIHCCTAVADAGTAGVATTTPTLPGFPVAVTAGSYDVTFDMTLASSYGGAFLTAHGGTTAGAFSALRAGLDDGKAYLNIHTSAFPPGEIRGFLHAVPEPASAALAALGLLLLCRRQRVRRA